MYGVGGNLSGTGFVQYMFTCNMGMKVQFYRENCMPMNLKYLKNPLLPPFDLWPNVIYSKLVIIKLGDDHLLLRRGWGGAWKIFCFDIFIFGSSWVELIIFAIGQIKLSIFISVVGSSLDLSKLEEMKYLFTPTFELKYLFPKGIRTMKFILKIFQWSSPYLFL